MTVRPESQDGEVDAAQTRIRTLSETNQETLARVAELTDAERATLAEATAILTKIAAR